MKLGRRLLSGWSLIGILSVSSPCISGQSLPPETTVVLTGLTSLERCPTAVGEDSAATIQSGSFIVGTSDESLLRPPILTLESWHDPVQGRLGLDYAGEVLSLGFDRDQLSVVQAQETGWVFSDSAVTVSWNVQYDQLSFIFKNKSAKTVRIPWQEGSLRAEDGTVVSISGGPNSYRRGGSVTSVSIAPADTYADALLLGRSEKWRRHTASMAEAPGQCRFGRSFSVVLPLRYDGESNSCSYSFSFTCEPKVPAPELSQQRKQRGGSSDKREELLEAWEAAVALGNRGADAEAIEPLRRTVEIDPKQHPAWARLGSSIGNVASTKEGEQRKALLDEAIECYKKAVKLTKNNAGYHINLGLIYAQADRLAEAKSELLEAVKRSPADAAYAYYDLGAVLYNSKRFEEAFAAWNEMLRRFPNHPKAALVRSKMGGPQE